MVRELIIIGSANVGASHVAWFSHHYEAGLALAFILH